MYNSTNLNSSLEKKKLIPEEVKKKKLTPEEIKEREARFNRMKNNIEANLANERIAKFKANANLRHFQASNSKISVQYAAMNMETKLYHLLTIMVTSPDLQVLDNCSNLPEEFQNKVLIHEMHSYFKSYFSVNSRREKIEIRAVIDENWEAYILDYPIIARSFGLERWFHYFIYHRPEFLDEEKALMYKKKYHDRPNLKHIYIPLDDYAAYTDLEMYQHWLQCLRKNATLILEDDRATLPLRYITPLVLKYMARYVSEWLVHDEEAEKQWRIFIKYYEKIQNAIGLEALFHYVLYKKPDLLPTAKWQDYKERYYRTSSKLVFKPSRLLLSSTATQAKNAAVQMKKD